MNRNFFITYILIMQIWLLLMLSDTWAEPVRSQINIDFSKTRKTVNPKVLGHHTLGYDYCRLRIHAKNCVNNGKFSNFASGQWDAPQKKPNFELLNIAKEIHASILRFPGGTGSHYYNWKETIGPLKKRPMFQFGLDEFLTLCKAIGAEPIIVLSYFTGTDQDLTDMIEYLNQPLNIGNANGGVDWAEVRAKNGHPEPYKVKYFEFGNEVYAGNKKTGSVDPLVYAQRYLECQGKLKAVDESIQLGAVLHETSWNEVIVRKLKDSMDFGVVHLYPITYRSDDGLLSAKKLFKIALAAPDQAKDQLEAVANRFRGYAGKDIPLAITEYNGQFVQKKPVPYRHCLGNALLNADLLRILITTDAPILCANYHQFANSYWGIVYNPLFMKGIGRYHKRPNYYVFELYAKHFGNRLVPLTVSCPGYVSPAFGTVQATTDKIGDISEESKTVSRQLTPELWKVRHCSGVDVVRNSEEIRVHFTGNKDINYHHAKITQPIEWNHKYRLTGKLKAEDIISGTGACVEIQDGRGWKKTRWAKHTHKVSGTTGWSNFIIEFIPRDSEAKSVNILIRRMSGGGPVTGSLRVKDVVWEDLGQTEQYPPTPYLSAISSTTSPKDKLYLMVLNKHLAEPVSATVRVKNFSMPFSANYWVLNGPSIDATNENTMENVKLSDGTFSIPSGSDHFRFTFEPHSLTAIELTAYK